MLPRVTRMYGTRYDDGAWRSRSARPRELRTPPGVALRFAPEPSAPSAWSFALSAGAAVAVGLWAWHGLFTLLFPELPEPAPAPQLDIALPPTAAARSRERTASTQTLSADRPARPRVAPARAQPRNHGPRTSVSDVPAFDPNAKPDMDLTAPAEPVTLEEPPSIRPTFLSLNSRPWAEVYMDGQRVGHTPVRSLRVLPGHYSVELVNRELGMHKRFELLLREGENVSRGEQLEED